MTAQKTDTAKVGGEDHAGLLAEAKDYCETSHYLAESTPRGTILKMIGAIEALTAERNSRPGFGVYTMMKKKLEAAEARVLELQNATQKQGVSDGKEIERLRRALTEIASCELIVAGDLVDIARTALSANSPGDENE